MLARSLNAILVRAPHSRFKSVYLAANMVRRWRIAAKDAVPVSHDTYSLPEAVFQHKLQKSDLCRLDHLMDSRRILRVHGQRVEHTPCTTRE